MKQQESAISSGTLVDWARHEIVWYADRDLYDPLDSNFEWIDDADQLDELAIRAIREALDSYLDDDEKTALDADYVEIVVSDYVRHRRIVEGRLVLVPENQLALFADDSPQRWSDKHSLCISSDYDACTI